MKPMSSFESLRLIQNRLTRELPQRRRPAAAVLENSLAAGTRAVILTGPRGVGKTTYLLEKARTEDWFYLSADHPLAASSSLV